MTNLLLIPPPLGTVLSLTGLPGGSNKAHDRSPYGNVGNIIGATWIRLPSGFWYLDFDGSDDRVNIPASPSLDIGNDNESYSILAWLNSSDTTSEIALRAGTGSSYAGQLEKLNGGKIRFVVWDGVNVPLIDTDTVVADGGWHLVGAVRNGSSDQLLIYLDGVQDATPVTDTAGDARDTSGVSIGYDGSGFWFTGGIARVRIFNRALSALEIQNIFSQEKHQFGVWER